MSFEGTGTVVVTGSAMKTSQATMRPLPSTEAPVVSRVSQEGFGTPLRQSTPPREGRAASDSVLHTVRERGIHEGMKDIAEGNFRSGQPVEGDTTPAFDGSREDERVSQFEKPTDKKQIDTDIHETTRQEFETEEQDHQEIPKKVLEDPTYKEIWGEKYSALKNEKPDGEKIDIAQVDREAVTAYYDKKAEEILESDEVIDDPEYHKILGEEFAAARQEAKKQGEPFDEAKQATLEKKATARYLREKDMGQEKDAVVPPKEAYDTLGKMQENILKIKYDNLKLRREFSDLRNMSQVEIPPEVADLLKQLKVLMERMKQLQMSPGKEEEENSSLVMSLVMMMGAIMVAMFGSMTQENKEK